MIPSSGRKSWLVFASCLAWLTAVLLMSLLSQTETREIRPESMRPGDGCLYVAEAPKPYYLSFFVEYTSDTETEPAASRSILKENGEAIGIAHAPHVDIRAIGAGRYSHWNREIFFSSSDCSDPTKNKRKYEIVVFPSIKLWVWISALLAAALLLIAARQLFRDSRFYRRMATVLGPKRVRFWVAALFLFSVAIYLMWPPTLPAEQVLTGPFQRGVGQLWHASIPEYSSVADSTGAGEVSPLMLYEDDTALGPAHATHAQIRSNGEGRYSHWGDDLYFSTSDNSDPNTNGRRYVLRIAPVSLLERALKLLPVFIWGILAGAVLPQVLSAVRVPARERTFGFWILPVAGVLVIGLLAANVIDVAAWWGTAVYAIVLFLLFILFGSGLYATSRARMPQILVRVMQIWVALALTVLMVETGARILPANTSLAGNPGVKFFWPDWVYFNLNNYGHRDRDFSDVKTPNTFRILMLGDSYTEGAGLAREQTAGRLAEAALNARFDDRVKFEVYNLGHAGMNTREEVDVLLRDGPILKPDLVILGYVTNDAETHPLTLQFAETPEWWKKTQHILITRFGSYAFYLVSLHVNVSQSKYASAIDHYMAQHDKEGRGWRDVVQSLAEMQAWLTESKVDGVALIWPTFFDNWPTEGAKLNAQIETELKRHGLRTYDLTPLFAELGKPLSHFVLSPFDSHPNAEANEEVSKLIAEIVLDSPSFQAFLKRLNSPAPGSNTQ